MKTANALGYWCNWWTKWNNLFQYTSINQSGLNIPPNLPTPLESYSIYNLILLQISENISIMVRYTQQFAALQLHWQWQDDKWFPPQGNRQFSRIFYDKTNKLAWWCQMTSPMCRICSLWTSGFCVYVCVMWVCGGNREWRGYNSVGFYTNERGPKPPNSYHSSLYFVSPWDDRDVNMILHLLTDGLRNQE